MSLSLRELIRSDLVRFTQTYALRSQAYSWRKVFWESLLFKAGFQAVLLYRISYRLFRMGFIYLAWLVTRLNIFLTGAEIEFNAQIGPGMFIAHPVGIVIGRGTVIGSNVTIFQGVSFVVKGWDPDSITRFPVVGDNCFFFANAVILGNIRIGNDCVVAAQAVVTRDLPSGSLASGVPATILPDKGRQNVCSWNMKDKA